MASLFEIFGEIGVKGVEAAESGIDSVNNKAEGLADRIGTAGERMETFGNRVSGVGKQLSKISGILSGALGAVGGFVGKMTAMANETLTMSRRLGISTDAMQLWQQTASAFGIQQDALRDGFKELQMRADEFGETGAGPATEAFERLGLAQEEVNKKKSDTIGLFNTVIDRIKDVKTMAARQRILDELFGGQAAEQFPELLGASRKEIEKIQQAVRDRGSIISNEDLKRAREFQRTWKSFIATLTAVAQKVAIELLPAFEVFIDNIKGPLTSALQTLGTVLGTLSSAFAALPGPIQGGVTTLLVFTATVGPVLVIAGRLIGSLGKLVTLFGRTAGGVQAAGGAFAVLKTAVSGLGGLFASAVSAVSSVAGVLKGIFLRALRNIVSVLNPVTKLLGAFWLGWEAGKRVLNPLIELFPGLDRAIENTVGFIAVEVPQMLQQAWQKISQVFNNIVQGGVKAFQNLASRVGALVSQLVSSVVQAVTNFASQVKNGFIQLAKKAVQVVTNLASKVKQGFDQLAKKAIKTVTNLASKVKQKFDQLATAVPRLLSQAWGSVQQILSNIIDGFANAFQRIKDATIGRVKAMVDTVVSKVRAMWQALTGNSIIPQMADEAITAFDRMADGSEDAGERTRRGMEEAARSVDGPDASAASVRGRRAGRNGSGPQVIDMSHSTFRDDRDMLERMRRQGSDLTGAF